MPGAAGLADSDTFWRELRELRLPFFAGPRPAVAAVAKTDRARAGRPRRHPDRLGRRPALAAR